jgi:hypothetical protein
VVLDGIGSVLWGWLVLGYDEIAERRYRNVGARLIPPSMRPKKWKDEGNHDASDRLDSAGHGARGLRDMGASASRQVEASVLICRCAWHRSYYGYPLVSGVASWRGWTVRFTDGICQKYLERFRAEHRVFLERHRTAPPASIASDPKDINTAA